MPENLTLYLLLVVALGIGFLLGRRESASPKTKPPFLSDSYVRGVNYLLNDQHELAIDTFVEAMEVDESTVDTYLALGSLVRRRGEVDKAIRIHQSLLAGTALPKGRREQTELELARDYLSAGLLDRAENLLIELTQRTGNGVGGRKADALELLLQVYQRTRDWVQAIDVGRALVKQQKRFRTPVAHYHCELAEAALLKGDLKSARTLVNNGTGFSADCARLHIVGAKVEFASKRYREVKKLLSRARQLDSQLASEYLELFEQACEQINTPKDYLSHLEKCLQEGPYASAVAQMVKKIDNSEGRTEAKVYLTEQLKRVPTLQGLTALLDYVEPIDELELVKSHLQSLMETQKNYRCGNCGFSGHSLFWQCPSCQEWGSVAPIISS